MESEGVVFCRKCGAELVPGRGDFYVVNIEAYAEAGVLRITAEDLAKDQAAAMRDRGRVEGGLGAGGDG